MCFFCIGCDQDMIQKCSKIQLCLYFGLLCLSLLEQHFFWIKYLGR